MGTLSRCFILPLLTRLYSPSWPFLVLGWNLSPPQGKLYPRASWFPPSSWVLVFGYLVWSRPNLMTSLAQLIPLNALMPSAFAPWVPSSHNSPLKPHSSLCLEEGGFGVGWDVGTCWLLSHKRVSFQLFWTRSWCFKNYNAAFNVECGYLFPRSTVRWESYSWGFLW